MPNDVDSNSSTSTSTTGTSMKGGWSSSSGSSSDGGLLSTASSCSQLHFVSRLHIWGFGGRSDKTPPPPTAATDDLATSASTSAPSPSFTDTFPSPSQLQQPSTSGYHTDSFTPPPGGQPSNIDPFNQPPAQLSSSAEHHLSDPAGVSTSMTGFPLPEDSVEVAAALAETLDAVELSSIAAAKALAWTNASIAISGLTTVHETLGLPWWASIMVFNLSLRLMTFPLMIMSQKAGVKLMGINQKMTGVKRLHDMAAKATNPTEHARLLHAAQLEYDKQFKTTGNPVVTFLKVPAVMMLNGLIFVSIYWGVTDLMKAHVPSLTTGGMLWFTDLTVPDHTFALGALCAALTYGMVRNSLAVGGDMNMAATREQVEQLALIKRIMIGASLMFLPMSYYVSAGTAMLWVSNSTFMVMQGFTIRNASFRKLVGLPSIEEMRQMQADAVKAQGAPPAPGSPPAGTPPPGTSRPLGTPSAPAVSQPLAASKLLHAPPPPPGTSGKP